MASAKLSDTVRNLSHSTFSAANASSTAPTWVPDDEVETCMICFVPFTMFNRRHHCRNCGFIICNSCSLRRHVLPHAGSSPVRVCDRCVVDLGIAGERPATVAGAPAGANVAGGGVVPGSKLSPIDQYTFTTPDGETLPPVSSLAGAGCVDPATLPSTADPSKNTASAGVISSLTSQILGVLDVPAWTYAVKPFTSHGSSVRIGRCLVRVLEAKNLRIPGIQASAKALEALSFSEDSPYQYTVVARVGSGSAARTAFSKARAPHFRRKADQEGSVEQAPKDSGIDLINAYLDEETALAAAGVVLSSSSVNAALTRARAASLANDQDAEIVANCVWPESLVLDVSSNAESLRFDLYCYKDAAQTQSAGSQAGSGKSSTAITAAAAAVSGSSAAPTNASSMALSTADVPSLAPRPVVPVGTVSLPLFSVASQKRYRLWLRLDTPLGVSDDRDSSVSDAGASSVIDAPSDDSGVPAVCVEVQYIYNSLGFLWSQVSSPEESGQSVPDAVVDSDGLLPSWTQSQSNTPDSIALRNQALVSMVAAPRNFSIAQFLHDYFYFLYHFQFVWHILDLASGVLLWRLPLVTLCVLAVMLYVTFNPWAALVLILAYTGYHLYEGYRAASKSKTEATRRKDSSRASNADLSATSALIAATSAPAVSPQEVDMLASLAQTLLPPDGSAPGSSFRVKGGDTLIPLNPTAPGGNPASVTVPPIPPPHVLSEPGQADRALLAVLIGMFERLLPLSSGTPITAASILGQRARLLTIGRVAEFFRTATTTAESFWAIFHWSNPTLSLSVSVCVAFWLVLALIGSQAPLWFMIVAAPMIVRSKQFRLQTQAIRGLLRWSTTR